MMRQMSSKLNAIQAFELRERKTNAAPCCSCVCLFGGILPRLADGVKFEGGHAAFATCVCKLLLPPLFLSLLYLLLPLLMIMS